MAIVTVLGAGMMGSALTLPLADRGHEVRLVGTHLDREIIDSLRRSGTHPKLGVELPRSVTPLPLEALPEAIAGAELVALGVSSAGARWAADVLAPLLRPEQLLFMITKGLVWSQGELRVWPDEIERALPPELRERVHPAAVGGPCIAGELARRVETCVMLAGRDRASLERIAAALRTSYYHVWTSTDVVAVELCAALKNAYAMGVAFATGMHLRRGGSPGSVAMHNVESALFAQAVREMRAIVGALGGNRELVAELPGVGDLDVTTNGGRTGRFGALLGQGLSLEEAISRMAGATLECLDVIGVLRPALEALAARGSLRPAELPLFDHMAAVVLDRVPVELPLDRFFGGERGTSHERATELPRP